MTLSTATVSGGLFSFHYTVNTGLTYAVQSLLSATFCNGCL